MSKNLVDNIQIVATAKPLLEKLHVRQAAIVGNRMTEVVMPGVGVQIGTVWKDKPSSDIVIGVEDYLREILGIPVEVQVREDDLDEVNELMYIFIYDKPRVGYAHNKTLTAAEMTSRFGG